MTARTVGARGRITLGKELLAHLGVRPGDRIDVATRAGGRIEMRAARPKTKISVVFGMLKRKDGPRLSIDEMNRIAAQGWAGKR